MGWDGLGDERDDDVVDDDDVNEASRLQEKKRWLPTSRYLGTYLR